MVKAKNGTATGPLRVIGYLRVSTEEQVTSGAGLGAQRAALTARAAIEGWDLTLVADEGLSAKDMKRPALLAALARLDAGDADLLVAAKLDRVSRSVTDFSILMERARTKGWGLILLDLGVDTTTPAGEFVANTMANAAQLERKLIGQRTVDALAAKRAAGVRLGRPSGLPTELVARIVRDREQRGQSFRAIAAALTAEGIATAQGGRQWHASTVQKVLRGQDAETARQLAGV